MEIAKVKHCYKYCKKKKKKKKKKVNKYNFNIDL